MIIPFNNRLIWSSPHQPLRIQERCEGPFYWLDNPVTSSLESLLRHNGAPNLTTSWILGSVWFVIERYLIPIWLCYLISPLITTGPWIRSKLGKYWALLQNHFRRYFQFHFLEWKLLYMNIDVSVAEVFSNGFNWQYVSTGSAWCRIGDISAVNWINVGYFTDA